MSFHDDIKQRAKDINDTVRFILLVIASIGFGFWQHSFGAAIFLGPIALWIPAMIIEFKK